MAPNSPVPRRTLVGVFLISGATLLLELALTRAFDVMLRTNLSYLVVSMALFGLGLGGIVALLRPGLARWDGTMAAAAITFSGTAAMLPWSMDALPFNPTLIPSRPLEQTIAFLAMYLCLVLPFVASGLVLSIVFSTMGRHIQRLYFWDLVGAALGGVVIVWLVPLLGPAGISVGVAPIGLLAAWCFAPERWRDARRALLGLAAAAVVAAIWAGSHTDYQPHLRKRGTQEALSTGKVEVSHWDPISRIDVFPMPRSNVKHIAYDGGTQSSIFYPFDGDLEGLRGRIEDEVNNYAWGKKVYASHCFRPAEPDREVLVIGSAGGQETLAALVCGARHVDGIELVGTVVELGKGRYGDYTGNIFNRPEVNNQRGEGRTYLRSTAKKYDIIQIFSNHSSSSIAMGSGAMGPQYLITAEAFQEYFDHLKPDGILQINHHIYPWLLITAAKAWYDRGETDFSRHVFATDRREGSNLPTLLFKMKPWTPEEAATMRDFFAHRFRSDSTEYRVIVDPIDPSQNEVDARLMDRVFPTDLVATLPYRLDVATDDRPFFIRRTIQRLDPATMPNVDAGTAYTLNASLRGVIPLDMIHYPLLGAASILFAALFTLVPLRFSEVGRRRWPQRGITLTYFSCLGAGFIVLEMILIQIFRKLIGYPLHSFTTIIVALLLAAGCGSLLSGRLRLHEGRRWHIVFAAVLAAGLVTLLLAQPIIAWGLALPTGGRILLGAVVVFPIGLWLGMPFPIGIRHLEEHNAGAIPWAWGMNGLFSVAGGLVSALGSIVYGFHWTFLWALGCYALAWFCMARMKRSLPAIEESKPET